MGARSDNFELVNAELFTQLPADQKARVFGQDMVDIGQEFLGFVDIYAALAKIIPEHWTVVDLGCAYAPQSLLFKDHARYVGVDMSVKDRFGPPNATHYDMPIEEFVGKHILDFDLDTTFAICSYVPPWGSDNMQLARLSFKNVFTYYPAGEMKVLLAHRHPCTN